MRAKLLGTGGSIVLLLSVGGCDMLKGNGPTKAAKARAEVKRHKAACASPTANERLKNSIFDDAIAATRGGRANLDVLADYSVARMENPVVKGWDRSLDITRCEGRFILEVPPGAERAFGGERQLQADLKYTAQASADGAGLVYQQKGAEPIIEKLAAFNLGAVAYRPPPAIDQPQASTELSEQTPVQQPQIPSRPASRPSTSTKQSDAAARPPIRTRSAETSRAPIGNLNTREARSRAPIPSQLGNGEATVRAFYNALGAGNGPAASSQVIPEKRTSRAFSPEGISRFYGRLPQPLRLTNVKPLGGGAYQVNYRYSAGRSHCNGSAVVRLTNRAGRNLIQSIRSQSGC